jgi:archaellum component FlaF (FlaF/FlaG flagellin family)
MIRSSIVTLCATAFFASLVFTGIVYAQNQTQNQTSSQAASQNETMATVTDKPQTVISNQTTVPAEQTTVTVNQTTEPIKDQSQLQPLQNQTISSQTGNLSNIENKTMVQPTGPATTIIANKTTVPFNQTTIGMDNTTNSQTPSSGQAQQQNQSKGPIEQMGESLSKMIGGGK